MTIISSNRKKSEMSHLVNFFRGLNVDANLIRHAPTEEEFGYWQAAVSEQQSGVAFHLYGVWLDRRSRRRARAPFLQNYDQQLTRDAIGMPVNKGAR